MNSGASFCSTRSHLLVRETCNHLFNASQGLWSDLYSSLASLPVCVVSQCYLHSLEFSVSLKSLPTPSFEVTSVVLCANFQGHMAFVASQVLAGMGCMLCPFGMHTKYRSWWSSLTTFSVGFVWFYALTLDILISCYSNTVICRKEHCKLCRETSIQLFLCVGWTTGFLCERNIHSSPGSAETAGRSTVSSPTIRTLSHVH